MRSRNKSNNNKKRMGSFCATLMSKVDIVVVVGGLIKGWIVNLPMEVLCGWAMPAELGRYSESS